MVTISPLLSIHFRNKHLNTQIQNILKNILYVQYFFYQINYFVIRLQNSVNKNKSQATKHFCHSIKFLLFLWHFFRLILHSSLNILTEMKWQQACGRCKNKRYWMIKKSFKICKVYLRCKFIFIFLTSENAFV